MRSARASAGVNQPCEVKLWPLVCSRHFTSALAGACMPDSRSNNSLWPLPETPAMPTISPARKVMDTSFKRATPKLSRQLRCSACKSTAPVAGAMSSALRPRLTRRPTMACARPSTLVCAMGESSTTAPWRITVTASQRAMISLSLCVMSNTVQPLARKPRKVSKSASVSAGVSTAVGSSRMRMRAPR